MPGWKTPNPIVSLLGCALVTLWPPSRAGEATDEPLPEQFLEFLAEWSDERGNFQDPQEYDDPQWQVLDQKAGQTDE